MEKKKILCVFGNKVYYGHERSNVQVYWLLQQEGYDLLVLNNKDGLAPGAKAVFDNQSIRYIGIRFPDWSDMRKPFTLWKVLKYLTKVVIHNISFSWHLRKFRPDYILIGNDFMFVNLIPTFLFSRVKIIYRLGDKPTMGWKAFAFFWRKFIVKMTDRFVCISQFIHTKLIEAGRGVNKKDKVIYNYPPIRAGNDFSGLRAKRLEGLTFGYLGQIIQIKGVEEFIDAAIMIVDQYPDVYFLLAGDLQYNAEFSNKLLEKIKNSNSGERITFLGQIEDIDSYFEAIDVLVTPSIKEEPLGNVLVEAKVRGVPNIIFDSGGMPELIRHGKDGLICKDMTAASIRDCCQKYIDNPALINIHGENASKSIYELGLNYENYRQRWLSALD